MSFFSSCPWLDDYYKAEAETARHSRDFGESTIDKYFDTQCGINGWALAGVRAHFH
jgi:hypothetical protein